MGIENRCIPDYKTSIPVILLMSLLIFSGTANAQESSIAGTVLDSKTNEPIINATITVTHSQSEAMAMTQTDSAGYYEVTGLSSGTYIVKIEAGGYVNETHFVDIDGGTFGNGDEYELNVHLDKVTLGVERPSKSDESGFPFLYQTILIIIIVIVITVIMYSKIKRENLLKNAVRKRIFEYIKENPGKHYRAILNDLDLPMGVLTYHINRLEKAQYVKSRQDGMFRRFYTTGPKTEMRFFLSDIQESILSVIKENQGISQSNIAKKISVSRKVVNYHVNILDQAGLIFVESHGRESACYSVESETVKL